MKTSHVLSALAGATGATVLFAITSALHHKWTIDGLHWWERMRLPLNPAPLTPAYWRAAPSYGEDEYR